jgi:hypothetical protein
MTSNYLGGSLQGAACAASLIRPQAALDVCRQCLGYIAAASTRRVALRS